MIKKLSMTCIIVVLGIFFVKFMASIFSPSQHINNGYFVELVGTTEVYIFSENLKHEGIVVKPTLVALGISDKRDYIFALRQPKERIDGDTRYQKSCEFWVVNTRESDVIGPLTTSEYLKITKEIGQCDKCLHWNTIYKNMTSYCAEQDDVKALVEGLPKIKEI